MKTIEFECSGKFIAIFEDGKVRIRCYSDITDCSDYETLDEFVERHGGIDETQAYLCDCSIY